MTKGCGCEVDEAGVVTKPCANQDKPVTVARKTCGCCIAAFVVPSAGDGPAMFSDYAKEVRYFQRKGWAIEERTVGWVRHTLSEEGGLQFDCPHGRKRPRAVTSAVQSELAL